METSEDGRILREPLVSPPSLYPPPTAGNNFSMHTFAHAIPLLTKLLLLPYTPEDNFLL